METFWAFILSIIVLVVVASAFVGDRHAAGDLLTAGGALGTILLVQASMRRGGS